MRAAHLPPHFILFFAFPPNQELEKTFCADKHAVSYLAASAQLLPICPNTLQETSEPLSQTATSNGNQNQDEFSPPPPSPLCT